MSCENPMYLRHPYVYADYGQGTKCIENTAENVAKLLYAYQDRTVVISSSWGISLITMRHGYITRCPDKRYLYTRLYPALALIALQNIPLDYVKKANPYHYSTEGPLHWFIRYWRTMKETNLTIIEKGRKILYELKRVEAPSPFFMPEEDT